MTRYFLKLCWKNIWRNKRRTLITLHAIAFSVMALICIQNYYDAFHEQIIQNAIRFRAGHLLVTAPGFLDRNASSLAIAESQGIVTSLNARPEVEVVSPRVLTQGLLSSARSSSNIVFTGVEPREESRLTRYAQNITEGKFIDTQSNHEIVIGSELAKQLEVMLGSKVVALTQGVDGSIGNELFKVVGIFNTQSDADRSVAFIGIADARALLSLSPNAVHEIAVLLKSDRDLKTVQQSFSNTPAAQMNNWMEVQPHVMAMVELDRAINRLLMIIILLVAALGVANSILMCIMERTREFGVMMAIGTSRWEFIRMAIGETVLLSLVGIGFGNGLGILVTFIFGKTGFDLAWLTSKKLMLHGAIVQTVSFPSVHWETCLLVTAIIFILSFIVSIIPARYIANLTAVQALRS